MVNQGRAASQVALPCNAYCVCTLTARSRSLVQNPLRGADQQKSRSRNLGFVPWQNFATTPTVAAILPRNANGADLYLTPHHNVLHLMVCGQQPPI
jgi:hypothetical protein